MPSFILDVGKVESKSIGGRNLYGDCSDWNDCEEFEEETQPIN